RPDEVSADKKTPTLGFTPVSNTATVPGFGAETGADSWDAIRAKYDRRIVERVEESLKDYDANKNGVIDGEEWTKLRWSTSPRDADKNKDGRISRGEIAERYYQRYGGGGDSRSSSGGDSRSSSGGSSSSRSYGSSSGS